MEKLSERPDRHSEQMRSRGDKYFAEWEQEQSYTNPSIRQISKQRRLEMQRLYSQIPEAGIGVTGALKSYMRQILDIRTYLSNDLTPKGIDSIRPIAQQVAQNGEVVEQRVQPVISTIEQVRRQLTSGKKE